MKTLTTDVAIIGAGPSGAIAAALLCQKDYAVSVFERQQFPRFSIGESLLPHCMEFIEKAGMAEAVARAGFQHKNGAAFTWGNRYTYFDFSDKFSPGPGTTYQVQRAQFDKILIDEAQKQAWLETDLRTLLPQEQHWSSVQMAADVVQEKQLNQQIVALVGGKTAEHSFQLAEKIAQSWQTSGLFSAVFFQLKPELSSLKQEVEQLKLAVLPETVRTQLLDDPKAYFQHYAEQIVNPFNQTNLLPLSQDWLGFGRFVLHQSQQLSQMQWDMQNGTIFVEKEGVHWTLLRAELTSGSLLAGNQALLNLVQQNQQWAEQANQPFDVASTALFGAVAKQQAETESTLMSIVGVSLTLFLLLWVFRSGRVLWLFVPIMAGMAVGVAVTVLSLGHIHILTLVVGTSLIGVLIDFPLHWLSSALANKQWQPQQTMSAHLPTFLVSLAVTLLGYGLLWFTDLPVLEQTALFSAVALVVAILTTMLFLPLCFKPNQFAHRPYVGEKLVFPKWGKQKGLQAVLAVLVVIGLYRSEWKDDMRQWVAIPDTMLQQALQISQLTGIDLGSQYFLVVANNDEELLAYTQKISEKLTALSQPHIALSQWIMSPAEQRAFSQTLAGKLKPEDYAILAEVGVEPSVIEKALSDLANRPTVSLQDALKTTLGQGWKTLYLGEIQPNKVATMVKLKGMVQTEIVQPLADGKQIFWQDKRTSLNQAFQQTRNQAAWLKLLSFLFAGLFLWKLFGIRKTFNILLLPFGAMVITVALFGWLGLPITLFAMFGLLLVSAIGIDYCAYREIAKEPIATKQTAILLAALTTLISFGLLALSAPPLRWQVLA